MRKLTTILLLTLYSFSMLGLWVNVHLCDGIAESIQVLQEDADCCCEDEDGLREDCCTDEKVYFQFAQEVQYTPASLKVFKPIFHVLFKLNSFEIPSLLDSDNKVYAYSIEQGPSKEKIYLLNSSLVLYS